MRIGGMLLAAAALAGCTTLDPPDLRTPDAGRAAVLGSVEERSLDEIASAIADGKTSSEAVTYAYLARIREMDDAGPMLNAVIAVNPQALADARTLDAERRAGRLRGPLHGVPLLIKDNIETADPVATTAGSLALRNNITGRDAPLVARLRAAGAVILGKTNLSEWANFRSDDSTSGWSAVGGLTKNPYALDRNPCGSSSGTGSGIAASLAAAGIGTETDGSIICPSSINGLVGLKPTVGLVPRTHVVPISHSQDTAGPMARGVRDVAILLTVLAGSDASDPATAEADARKSDYVAALDRADGLRGVRIGVLRDRVGDNKAVVEAFDAALAVLRTGGAELVEIADSRSGLDGMGDAEFQVLLSEFKADLNAYLASTPATVTTRTLAQVIAFNKTSPAELEFFGQDLLEQSEATTGLDDPAYLAALSKSRSLARGAIDRLLKDNHVTLLVGPSNGPAWRSTLGKGDDFAGPSQSALPAIAGYPHLTVPMGLIDGLPVGLSLIGPAWSEAALLAAGYRYEQLSRARVPPGYRPAGQ